LAQVSKTTSNSYRWQVYDDSSDSDSDSDSDFEGDRVPNKNNLPNDDIDKIILFLKHMQIDLDFFVEQYQKIVPKHDDLQEIFDIAWREARPNFTRAIEYLRSKKPYRALAEVGLRKNQLDLKLRVFYLARDEFQTAKEYFDSSEKTSKEKNTKLRKAIDWLFEHGDTILGSLGSIRVPGTEAISEILDVGKILIQKYKVRKKSKNS